MTADGLFSVRRQEFADFLGRVGSSSNRSHAFVARNFLLDEWVVAERASSYEESDCAIDHGSYTLWLGAHNTYLTDKVFLAKLVGAPLVSIDPEDADTCPETFQHIDPSSPFLPTDEHLHLLRLEQIGFIANMSGQSPERVRDVAQRVVDSGWERNSDYEKLSDILAEWMAQSDARPVFAGYWQDLADCFGEPPERDASDWPGKVRDRLGLMHLKPDSRSGNPIPVIALRYPVTDIPGLRGQREVRPLVPPTVLDGRHSAAFCPAPREAGVGHTVDLGENSPPTCREVLHPPVNFQPEHVWRVGEIRDSVSDEQLVKAREWHIICIRDLTGREEYASGTDGDILGE